MWNRATTQVHTPNNGTEVTNRYRVAREQADRKERNKSKSDERSSMRKEKRVEEREKRKEERMVGNEEESIGCGE